MGGASEAPPPSGIGDCSKTHLYIDLKLLDFSYISKTKMLKKKEIRFFTSPPSEITRFQYAVRGRVKLV